MKIQHLVSFVLLLGYVQAAPRDEHIDDELESLYFEYGTPVGPEKGTRVLGGAETCTNEIETNNRSIPAEFIRLAYHDSATHNKRDGTGGLDGSIRFRVERQRPENVGALGMFTTFLRLHHGVNQLVSWADAIAFSVVAVVAGCDGPLIPFRGGRIDATEPGPPGVPEPHQSLESHTESFKRQGFNKEEMIALVACGHTIGGVRSLDFPQHVPPAPDNDQDNIHTFDTTHTFDNAVVTEYLSGNTQSPLVNHPNTTMLSDLRIFNSDGNRTMTRLANPKTFQKTCGELLERMINSVPKNVKLRSPVKPIPIKVGVTMLEVTATSRVLQTSLRFMKANPQRQVTLHWADTAQRPNTFTATSYNSSTIVTPLATKHGVTPTRYWFATPIGLTSISKYWFTYDEMDGRGVRKFDNKGKGFPIEQDQLLFAPQLSGQGFPRALVVGLRSDLLPSSVTGMLFDFNSETTTPTQGQVLTFTRDTSIPDAAGYSFYKAEFFTSADGATFDVQAVVNGKTIKSQFLRLSYLP
ncbi:heme peroxidase [Panaeolus papilionaceus]|nr:heme peroxidase [Panaeolus papilionaceus]